ncbi:MAG: iron-sulfur cluster assembly scaffold protein [Candidatus Lokiarchaeota archaeon]|nr:iron-sulfur cluster assembly scaffold protein [Candidatus Lokiarchaeota archaeon]
MDKRIKIGSKDVSKNKSNDFIKKLQGDLKEKDLEEYNKYIINLFHNPQKWGKLPDEEITVSHSYEGPCGDSMEFFLKINGDKIEKANFITNGCRASFAAACQTMLLIEEKPLDYAEKLTAEDIDKALKGLPEDHKHCAELAIRTLKHTIEIYKNQYKPVRNK